MADSPAQLIAARAVMGVGGALVLPSTLSILITVFDEKERRTAMSAWSAVAMVGLIGGPALGGVLIGWFWWGAVFLVNVPIAALAIVAAYVLMPESKGSWQKPDPLGAVLSSVGMVAVFRAIIELSKGGFGHTTTLATLVVSLAFNGIGAALGTRTGNRPLVALGLVLTAAGFFALSVTASGGTSSPWPRPWRCWAQAPAWPCRPRSPH
ncbi:MFS transporter [Streptomyces uncialis]|uniref:MFS transporter n=1 Tax=Streptomyces uncialis TaxID=1048205 RepID=UPI00381E72C8